MWVQPELRDPLGMFSRCPKKATVDLKSQLWAKGELQIGRTVHAGVIVLSALFPGH